MTGIKLDTDVSMSTNRSNKMPEFSNNHKSVILRYDK